MNKLKIDRELHANTRRTRITYHGWLGNQEVAVKCYLKPLAGLYHWLLARHKGKRLRKAGAPVPDMLYAGWLPDKGCFCTATAFLTGYQTLKQALLEETSPHARLEKIQQLGQTIKRLHTLGIEQPDGNLTNFLINENNEIAMVDEDDILIHQGQLGAKKAMTNLANIATRFNNKQDQTALLTAYKANQSATSGLDWDDQHFWQETSRWTTKFDDKRARRAREG